MKAAILFDNIGPYHAARLRASAEVLDVLAVQLGSSSVDYAWTGGAVTGLNIATVNPEGAGRELQMAEFRRRLEEILEGYGPEVVFVNGWGFRGALIAMAWARREGVRVVVMSETRRVDGARSWWGEWVKSRIVGLCDAGLCGGESHRRYLWELGLAGERVVLGYNAVDNDFFGKSRELGAGREAPEARRSEVGDKKGEESLTTNHTNLHERGEEFLTTDKTDEYGCDDAGQSLAGQAGAVFSNPSPSELGRDFENSSLIRYADNPASAPATSHSLLATAPKADPQLYFLASNRFVERKNLKGLIRAYAKYVESFQFSAFSFQESSGVVWPLVLLGDGELRGELEALCEELGIKAFSFQGSVFSREEESNLKLNSYKLKTPAAGGLVVFAGFRQIEELPFFYGGAGVFIHPALSEPWGLVINEAMASGLPILSSKNVGAAEELVRDGVNGFTFDPENIQELAGMLVKMADMRQEEREAMGEASRRLIADWGPERFARGAQEAVRAAMSAPPKRVGLLDRFLLEILIRK